LLTAPAAPAQAPGELLSHSPPGKIMVADANIKATFSGRDIRSSGPRMRLMVARLLEDIYAYGGSWRPDVVLLQEAISREREPGDSPDDDQSAKRVATELGLATGDPYGIVIDPGSQRSRGLKESRETAIVANLATMKVPDLGGFVNTSGFKRKRRKAKNHPSTHPAKAPGRRQAWAILHERAEDGLAWPVASVHLLHDRRLGCRRGKPCQRSINRRKSKWSLQVSEILRTSTGDPFSRAVIGGDFNANRKEPFYGTMLRLGYLKAVRGRIDYIFTRAPFGISAIDQRPRGSGRYNLGYSDHPFLWAQVG